MIRSASFSTIVRKLTDAWIASDPDRPAKAEEIYSGVVDQLTLKMRLTVFRIVGNDPLNWQMTAIRHSGFKSRILNINKLFADCKIGEFKDRRYMEEAVIPRLIEVIERQQPSSELVKTRLLGINLGYDRILLPQKNIKRPEWIISSSNAQFLLSPPQRLESLDIGDEAILQLLMEGSTAKEIATTLEISHRTVEHRLERIKAKYGAKNNVHLVAMLMATRLVNPGG